MDLSSLRIALFSGNYNFVKDGANQALNRLVGYLLRQGAAVRVYSPTTDHPAFPATGDLVSVPSVPLPGREEYRFAFGIMPAAKRDLRRFAPNIVHVSAPEMLGHRAVSWARWHDLPIVASVHTRFETYPRYYNLAFLEPVMLAILRRFYRRCDALVAPSDSFAQILREQRMNYDIGIWSRGLDHELWNPGRRDLEWRRAQGIADDEVVIGFLGRIVMEKGLDVFAEAVERLTQKHIKHRVLIVGEGPARDWFQRRLPDAVFTGFQMGPDLARAVAGMDIFLNPSVTETFGNVSLESMACGIPVVAARAAGSEDIVQDGVTGLLVRPGAIEGYANALARLATDHDFRARMGQAGIAEAAKYEWDRINAAVAETYLRVIRNRQTRL
ncbi:HMA domain-containing protein [Sphingomonas antarctica]|uniref:glycosyltransferase family 4 protein n=1 Tax=Sphingomonas antarctica TaxID=2040274 RepID=UPI0039ECA400